MKDPRKTAHMVIDFYTRMCPKCSRWFKSNKQEEKIATAKCPSCKVEMVISTYPGSDGSDLSWLLKERNQIKDPRD